MRPAFYLNLPSVIYKSGSGSENDPYCLTGNGGSSGGGDSGGGSAWGIDAVNSTDEEVLTQSELDDLSLLENISLGQSKINGPYVSILGKKFYLFAMDGNLNINLGDKLNVQFSVDSENKSVQALIGFKAIDADTEIGQEKWQDMYSQTKDLYKAFNGSSPSKNAYDKLRTLNKNVREQNKKLFANIEGKFAGYLEWAYESGSLSLAEGGIIITAKAGGSIEARVPSFPAAYATVGLSVTAEGNIVIKDDKQYKSLSISSSMTVTPELSAGVGIGSKNFHIEGGLKGNLELKIAAVTGYFKSLSSKIEPFTVTATGSLYLEGKAGIFKAASEQPVYGPEQWYPKNSVSLSEDLDSSDFELISRDYLNNDVELLTFDPLASFSKANLYPYNSPELAVLNNGTRLLVWTDDNGEKGDADVTSIFYSIYNSEAQSWSDYATLWDNDGYNGDPVVYCDGNEAYILWQRVEDSQSTDIDVYEQMSKTDLYCSVFDGTSISEPVLISDADRLTYESLYDISGEDGNILVTWAENSNNDLFMTEGTNTVYSRQYVDGVWQDEKKVDETSLSVTDLKADLSDGNARIIYNIYSEDDESGTLYINKGGTTEYRSTYTSDCDEIQVSDNELYHMIDGEVYIYDISTGTDTATGITGLSNFEVIKNGDNKAILSLVSTGFTCEMYGAWYVSTEDKWGNMIQLTDYDKYIRNYSAQLKDDGNILMAVNLVDINDDYEASGGDLYGTADLKVIENSEYNDLVLNYVTFDDESVTAGTTLPINFNVTNNSLNGINTVTGVLKDSDGNQLTSSDISCDIKSGESADLTFDYTLPSSITKRDITLTVSCDYDDSDTSNNSNTFEIGTADIAVKCLSLQSTDTGATVTAYIKNNGYEKAENVSVNVYDSNVSDILLGTLTVGELDAQAETSVAFDVPSSYYRLLGNTTLHAFYFEAVTDTTEAVYSNNSKKILFSDLGIGYKNGDVNADGNIDGIDAALVLRYIGGFGSTEAMDMTAADYNKDGAVNVLDAIGIINSEEYAS